MAVLPTIHRGFMPVVPPIEWLVQDFIAKGVGTILFGQPGVSKSVHATIMCAHLALGRDFGPLKVPRGGVRVLYLDLDVGWQWSHDLLLAVFRAHGFEDLPDGFRYWSPHTKECKPKTERPVILLEDLGQDIAETAREHGSELIVVDSLGQFMGGDQNEARDVALALRRGLNPAREEGAAVLVIDHSTKAASVGGRMVPTPAGSQQKRAWARVTVALEEESAGENTVVARWTVDKSNTRKFKPFCTRLNFQMSGDALERVTLDDMGLAGPRRTVDEAITALDNAKNAILQRLEGGPAGRGELNANRGTGQRALDELVSGGFVVRRDDRRYQLRQTNPPAPTLGNGRVGAVG